MTTDIKANEAQLECINSTQGKFLVLAGPGTGKTYTIIQRILALLEQGVDEQKILCLTFSDAAAIEMKSRLSDALNKPDIKVGVYTYHGFCNEIITNNSLDFELPSNFKVISQSVSRQYIKECIQELEPVEYRSSKNDPYVFLETILYQIQEIKKNRFDKQTYFENIKTNPDWEPQIKLLQDKIEDYKSKDKKIPKYITSAIESVQKKINKAKEIWDFYELYKKKMEFDHYLDFSDMINFVLEKFDNDPAFVDKIANKYDYILVDEYQDTNKSQNEILFNLADNIKTQNVFVVGDDDQIIYTFQGAALDTIEKFLKKYPDTKVICLKENMRSTDSILKASRSLILQDPKRLEVNPEFSRYNISKQLTAKNEKINKFNKPVKLNKYFDTDQEYCAIIDDIENLIKSPDCPKDKNGVIDLSQIAILAKTNAELGVFYDLLKNRNIPCELKDGKNIFEIKSSIVLYYYLKMLSNPELNSDKILKLLLTEPFNIDPVDYTKILELNSKNALLINSMKSCSEFSQKEKIDNFIKTYEYLKDYKNTETLRNIVIETGAKTGIFDYFINTETNKTENILGLKKLVDEAVEYSKRLKKVTLEEFIEYLDMALRDDIAILTSKPPFASNAIQLCTYHSCKGKEFDCVYMPTLMHNYWEADNSSLKPSVPVGIEEYKNDDELKEMKISDKLKLMYVGFTRAKHTLNLSFVENIGSKPKSLSEFVLNIENGLQKNDCSNYDINSYLNTQVKTLTKRTYDYKKDFSLYIDSLINDRFYSPSAVNVYLNCKRQYLYSNLMDLSAKTFDNDALNYGSCIHGALQYALNYAMEKGSYPDNDLIVGEFKKQIDDLPLSNIENRKNIVQRGEKALTDFYPQLITTPIKNLHLVEYKLKEKTQDFGFYGIVDRIDKNEDGSYSIYDYKTGNAKTLKMITEGDYKNYYNQLALYKYFFEQKTGKKVKEVGLIFPEDYTNNLTFKLTEKECDEVLDEFKNAISGIKNHDFEPSYDKSACKYCEYRDFCGFEAV